MITIIDYGMGNLGSIQNMFKRIGVSATVSADVAEIDAARKLLLPGVGAFDHAMTRINESGLRDALERKAMVERVPVLGICLGMQLLTRSSEEGALPGLGWIAASAHRFPAIQDLKVPHMGWNVVEPVAPSALTAGLFDDTRFYFVHSYYVKAEDEQHSILKATHGVTFDAGIQAGNIMGVQFHPEKSHKFGKQLLTNFAKL